MDLASILGLVIAGGLVVMGITWGKDASVLLNFYDFSAILITFGGSVSVILASYSLQGFLAGIKSIRLIFKTSTWNIAEIIQKIIDLSNVARKDGLLSLEETAEAVEDEFLQKGILLIVDGTDPELVRTIMETELMNMDVRHKANIGFWADLGAMGPAWGMIGTLIGLINMLKHMDDAASIGPAMAVALVTTFYGSMLANLICAPVGNKLKAKNEEEIMMKEIMIEGLLSIQAGENPRIIEEKLKSFLAPAERNSYQAGGEEID